MVDAIIRSGEGHIYVKLWVEIREHLYQVKATDLLVFIALATHIDNEGVCFPSLRTLQRLTGFKRSTIIRSIKRLEDIGWIVYVDRGYRKGGCHAVNRYHLNKWFVEFGK
jgi:predicted transcriptional regulator